MAAGGGARAAPSPASENAIAAYVLKRLALAAVTLVVLSVVVFAAAQLLPGDPGRAILGPFADQRSVDLLNEQLGANEPVVERYAEWAGGVVRGDLGTSYQYSTPVGDFVWDALVRSLKLALLALVLVVPLGILAGVAAALRSGRVADRTITVFGLSLSVIPELVSGIVLLLVFAVWLGWLPTTAQYPEGAGPATQLRYLLLPALPLVLILFGYIARMARAGTLEAIDADYTRTAVLKGLPARVVIRRHVLRNGLVPTIAVIATQIGYLLGGLVAIEILFNYNGLGLLIWNAAKAKDFAMLQSAVLVIGAVYLLMSLVADILSAALNPRIRLGGAE
ncbi:MAG TPA: ABC transporter permease [Gaiella sp.]|nr:ABC transporter permease [Gaiella sp.]